MSGDGRFVEAFQRVPHVPVDLWFLAQASYPYLLLTAIALELVGGVLFLLNRRFGAQLLVGGACFCRCRVWSFVGDEVGGRGEKVSEGFGERGPTAGEPQEGALMGQHAAEDALENRLEGIGAC